MSEDLQWDGFFTVPMISRLTGIPHSTLYDWRLREIIFPSLAIAEGKRVEEGYSYATVTVIRLLRWLREYKLDFKSAADAFRHLYERLGPPGANWASEYVYFFGPHVFVNGQDGFPISDAAKGGQFVLSSKVFFGDLFEELADLKEGETVLVPREFRKDVQIDPHVMGGEPVMWGTRVPTSTLHQLKGAGQSDAAIARLYVPTPKGRILKCLEYEEFLDSQAA